MRKLVFLFIMLSFVYNGAFAQTQESSLGDIPRNYLVIKPFDTNLVNSFEMNQINKIMLQVATKQTSYHLLISETSELEGVKTRVTSLQLSMSQKDKNFEITAGLFDLKEGKQINLKRADQVQRKDLQRQIYLLLESLFGLSEKKKMK